MPRVKAKISLAKIGKYRIAEKIGQGGQGKIYLSHDPTSHEAVAIKVLPGQIATDPVAGMRFVQECKVSAQLDHPNLVRVIDYGLDGSKPFMVMEYVDGESIGARLDREGRIPPVEAVKLAVQVGQALDWAHQRKLIHRDIKPDNILVTQDGQAKLTDLGLAKDQEGDFNLTRTLSFLGTPNFMAPEQFEDAKRADAQSDLYSLAATLYMMLTGELPFRARTAQAIGAIYKKKLTNEIAPPRELVPQLSEAISAAILRALRADRKERTATVHEFINALTEHPVLRADSGLQEVPVDVRDRRAAKRQEERDRRRKERFASRRKLSVQPLEKSPDLSWPGKVVNISQTGLCLELSRSYAAGVLLRVEVESKPAGQHTVVVRVMWVKQKGPKSWEMGCQYEHPLGEVEVHELC
jgi:serine/threonine protein kinase